MRFKEYLNEEIDLANDKNITFGDFVKKDLPLSKAIKDLFVKKVYNVKSYRELLSLRMFDAGDFFKMYGGCLTTGSAIGLTAGQPMSVMMHFSGKGAEDPENVKWDANSYKVGCFIVIRILDDNYLLRTNGEEYFIDNVPFSRIKDAVSTPPHNIDDYYMAVKINKNPDPRFYNQLYQWVVFK